MFPSVLAKSLMSNMVISARQLLQADATLAGWSGGKIHRSRDLGPVTVDGVPCVGNHIVVTPGTLFGQPNPNNETDANFSVAFGIAFAQPYASMDDAEDAPQDVVELIQIQLQTDPVFQTTFGSPLAEYLRGFPLIDAEPRFTAPESPDGFLSFEATYRARIDFVTRQLT